MPFDLIDQHRPRRAILLILLLATLTTPPQPLAQPLDGRGGTAPVATGSTGLPSVSQVESKLAELESATDLDETTKASLTEQYRRALSNLADAKSYEAKASKLAQTLETAPSESKRILDELDRQTGTPASTETVPDALPADLLDQRLSKVLAEASVEEIRVGELEKLIDETAGRPDQARARMAEIKQALEQIDADLRQPSVPDESESMTQARRWALETRRKALRTEGLMLEQELLSQSAREALYKARRDQAALKLAALKTTQRELEARQSKRRTAEAETAQLESEQAQRAAFDKDAVVRSAIEDNAEIADSLGRLARRIDEVRRLLAGIEAERTRIEEDFRGARQRLDAAGLSKALGQVLLERRSQLPDRRQIRSEIADRDDEIADATLQQIRHREEKRRLRDLEHYLDEQAAESPSLQDAEVRQQLREVLAQRKRLLSQVLDTEDDYIQQLGELNYAAEQVVLITGEYLDLLNEHLLWVRSAPAVGVETLIALPSAIAWLLAMDGWSQILQTLASRLQGAPLFWLELLTVALLFWRLSSLRRAIRATAEPLRRVRTDRIRFTLRGIGLSLLAALPLPLLLWSLGQQLLAMQNTAAYPRAFGTALCEVSFGLYYLLAFRMLCINGGVADRHFRWSTDALKRIRHNFDWFTAYVIPVAALTIAVYAYNQDSVTSSLGRLSLLAAMLGFALFYARLLSPAEGVLKGLFADHPGGWLNRLRRIWYPLIVGSPLVLAILALIGYVYTARILFESLVYQTWLALALVVLHQTIVRWLILTRRRLALQAALERQAARRAQAQSDRTEPSPPSEVLAVEETEPDLAALDEQTRRLINACLFIGAIVGLWLTWSDVLPAFNILEQVHLWSNTSMVEGTEHSVPVTAADIGLVVLIVILATIAAKNLPALLEILLLQSDSVSAGARYTIKTLASYAITAAAVLLAFSTLGLSWSKAQWLVAALGVGIGFGLQEIVANFISGIIILFERPVRVGDIVTVGDTTGVVTNIRIRATTIRNWEKQELLVPNKEFITSRLLNWSLTDQQNRVTIIVGVEYGSDTTKALDLLDQVAKRHERVLTDPAPLISFEGFGDNALMLYLRCYLDSLDGRTGVISALHQDIYETYRKHGIGIAFPQRDIHLKACEPLEVRLERPGRRPAMEPIAGEATDTRAPTEGGGERAG